MSLGVLAFIAGVLSVLAPCVLPVLPVILGSSLGAQKWYKPLIIVLSTGFFITFFTVILKASTSLIDIPESFWISFSAVIIILYGITLLFPSLWEKFAHILGLDKANTLIGKAKDKKGIVGDVLLGAALGPIFASCSPTYALLLSLVFPHSFIMGIVYTLIYSLGFSLFLLVIAYGGRAIVQKLHRAANPRGWFKKTLGIILVVTGVLIGTGLIKKIETGILDAGLFDVGIIEQALIEESGIGSNKNSACFTSPAGVYSCGGSAVQMTGGVSTITNNDPRERLLNANVAAPEFAGLENRINTSGWSSIRELRGKVVIVDFWTYSCINCIRTLPYIEKLHETYQDKGLVIIGVHAPEFQFERSIDNVKKAAKKFGLTYPIVQDNNFATWRNYDNLYRPAKYIIDRDGVIRYTHFGEGKYEETEQVIQYLLGLSTGGVIHDNGAGGTLQQTSETYLGSSRRARYSGRETDKLHEWRLTGKRQTENERVVLTTGGGSVTINAYAKEVNLVLGVNAERVQAEVYIDGMKTKQMMIDSYQLYNLMSTEIAGKHKVEIRFSEPGAMAYAYTFG